MNNLIKLTKRLLKINIVPTFVCNYPWIYLTKINGIPISELRNSEHGFVVGYFNLKNNNIDFLDFKELFNIIRKYR